MMRQENTVKKWALAISMFFPLISFAFGSELVVDHYKLTEKNFASLELDQVYDGLIDPNWYSQLSQTNPSIASNIEWEKIATIEVATTFGNSFGASDPFFIEARKRAAYLGANTLEYVSGVEMKNTGRVTSMTFRAHRIAYKSKIFPPDYFYISNQPIKTLVFEEAVSSWNEKYDKLQKVNQPQEADRNAEDNSDQSENNNEMAMFLAEFRKGDKITIVLKNEARFDGLFSRINNDFVFVCPPGNCLFNEEAILMTEIKSISKKK